MRIAPRLSYLIYGQVQGTVAVVAPAKHSQTSAASYIYYLQALYRRLLRICAAHSRRPARDLQPTTPAVCGKCQKRPVYTTKEPYIVCASDKRDLHNTTEAPYTTHTGPDCQATFKQTDLVFNSEGIRRREKESIFPRTDALDFGAFSNVSAQLCALCRGAVQICTILYRGTIEATTMRALCRSTVQMSTAQRHCTDLHYAIERHYTDVYYIEALYSSILYSGYF